MSSGTAAAGRRTSGTVALLLVAALAACSSDDLPEAEFKVLEPSREAAPQTPAAPVIKRPILTASKFEVGTMRNGRLFTVYGESPASGWFDPELRPLNGGRLADDGWLEYEFVAAPPELNGGEPSPVGTEAQRRVQGLVAIPDSVLRQAGGIRFYTEGGALAIRFTTTEEAAETSG